MKGNRSSVNLPVLALLAVSIMWGYNWVIMKESMKFCGPLDFAAMRSFLGALLLLGFLLIRSARFFPKEPKLTILLGFFSTTGAMGLTNLALVEAGAGRTTVLFYIMPFWLIILSRIFLSERMRGAQWIAVCLAFSGLMIMLEPWKFGGTVLSTALAVLAGFFWAVSSIIMKIIRKRTEIDLVSLSAWQMMFGAIPLAAAALMVPSMPVQWNTYLIGSLAYNAVFTNAIAVALWFYALEKLPAGLAGMGTLATPVIGLTAAAIELSEIPTNSDALGMFLILAGLAMIFFRGILKIRGLPCLPG